MSRLIGFDYQKLGERLGCTKNAARKSYKRFMGKEEEQAQARGGGGCKKAAGTLHFHPSLQMNHNF